MLSIGDFARLGQVSVRMLRHYDGIGLLVPARVDPSSGYRSYDPRQLARLNRLLALKDLGFTLAEVGAVLDDDVSDDQLRGMLRLRRSQLAAEHAAATERLAHVEHRLRLIEKEQTMSDIDLVTKELPALRLVAGTATLGDRAEIADAIVGLFDDAAAAVARAGGSLAGAYAIYDGDPDGLRLTAGYTHSGDGVDAPEVAVVDVPGAAQAVCAVHLGEMATIGATWQALHTALVDRGLEPAGPAREHYVRAEPALDQSDWVTELQQPVRPVS